jgi:excisionase family DNA binding protein
VNPLNIDPDKLYTPGEVAALFRVDPKTVARWAKSGRLPAVHTLGGHRRYPGRDILAALERVRSGSWRTSQEPAA